jgi:PAS domain S-box-containing protein
MKNSALLRIIFFYLMLGIVALLIIGSVIEWRSVGEVDSSIKRIYLYKDLLCLLLAAIAIYFSVSFFNKGYQTTALNYQKIFNGSPLPMFVMDKVGFKILAVNDAMVKLYGYSESEFLELTAFDIRPEEEHQRVRDFLSEHGGLTTDSGTWLHQKKNGERFYVQITFHSVPLTKAGAYIVMVSDIDKSINDEKKINDLLSLYETVNKATNDVIWDYDVVADQLNWMQGYDETYGYTKESTPNAFWAMQKIHPDDRERVQAAFRQVLDEKRTDWTSEYRYICADGSTKYIRDRGYVIFDEKGVAVRMIGAMQNIDKQKRHEQQLLAQNEQLKEIAWINSHQVRRPLSNIIGLITLIKDAAEHQEDVRELVDLLAISSRELDSAVILINRQILEGRVE